MKREGGREKRAEIRGWKQQTVSTEGAAGSEETSRGEGGSRGRGARGGGGL